MNRKKLKELLEKQEEARNERLEKILNSSHPKKVIISGPGTGKTYTFKELFKKQQGKYLALTFINNLAEKLEKDLNDIAKSCTFHSFCIGLLHKIKNKNINEDFVIFPKLELIIKSDAQIILNEDLDFKCSFAEIDYKSKDIPFFLERSGYYNAVSFYDSVYRVFEYFKKNPNEIPEYDHIVVDEYQDFNKLEVEFINILETKSPILIVGDDDQALYTQLKYASLQYIREKIKDHKYKRYYLPFCSRCTEVVIGAIHNIVKKAKENGKLEERVNRDFHCYLPEKYLDNEKYPKIVHANCSVQRQNAPYIAKFIEQEIDNLKTAEIEETNSKSDYTVLITGPKRYLKQINSYLKQKGKYILDPLYKEFDPEQKKIKIFEGYKVLLENKFSNLGWRILLECDSVGNIENLLKETLKNNTIQLYDYLPRNYIKRHEFKLNILKKVRDEKKLTPREQEELENFFNLELNNIKLKLIKEEDNEKRKDEEDYAPDKITVALTTYVGCKGLSAGFVFIVGLNDGILPENNNNPSDTEICKFIVALARTIKKCYLISVNRFAGKPEGEKSSFIDWINTDRITFEEVNAKYWKRI